MRLFRILFITFTALLLSGYAIAADIKNIKASQKGNYMVFIYDIEDYKFVDRYTIATFHSELGKALIATGEKKEGLHELMKTHDMFKDFHTPIYEDLGLLTQIVEFYTQMKDY